MVALKGNSFCTSAKDALKLIFANLGLVAAAGVIQDVVLFIGQWTITGGTVACCWIYLNAVASDPTLLPENVRSVSGVTTSFPVFTFILIVIISYCIGAVFMEVFGQIIDTLLLCFCEDTENVRVPPFLAFLRLYTSALTLRFADFLCSTSKSMRRLL
jgi:choline transporter-like protein 2/4/5